MPKFEYTNNSTRAAVSFPAHKFPHTSSVYYQCNVRLCINNGGCDQSDCGSSQSSASSGGPRKKRFIGQDQMLQGRQESAGAVQAEPLVSTDARRTERATSKSDMSFDVYSGLYVSDMDVGGKWSSSKASSSLKFPY